MRPRNPEVIENGFRGVATRNQRRPHVYRARLRVDAGCSISLDGLAEHEDVNRPAAGPSPDGRPPVMPADPPSTAFALTRAN